MNAAYNQSCDDIDRSNAWTLLWLLLALTFGGWLLLSASGPPRLPDRLPDLEAVKRTLTGSELPPVGVTLYVLSTAAWALWGWFALSLMLQLALAALHALTRGALWVLSLRGLADRLTPALVRRAVKPLTLAALVLTLARNSAPDASAATSGHAQVLVADNPDPDSPGVRKYRSVHSQDAGEREYTVEAGDTLWELSEEVYGSGEQWERILEANRGRAMPDGRRFDGRLRPGDVLRIPEASRPAEPSVIQRYYGVRYGDTLRSIAAQFLADETRWPEIYELNKGKARLGDGRVLSDPDLIWPGLELELPQRKLVKPAPKETRARTEQAPQARGQQEPSTKRHETKPGTTGQQTERPESSAPGETGEGAGQARTEERARSGRSAQDAVKDKPRTAATETLPPAPSRPTPVQGRAAETADQEQSVPQERATPGAAPMNTLPTAEPPAPHTRVAEWPARDDYGQEAAVGLASAAEGSGALLLGAQARRRRRTVRAGEMREDGYMQPEDARRLARRLHDGEFEPAVRVTQRVAALLETHGLENVSALTAQEGPKGVQLTLTGGLAEESRVFALAEELADTLGTDVEAYATRDRDVAVRVGPLADDPQAGHGRVTVGHPPLLVALGKPAPGHTLYVNWRAVDHLLVAGDTGGGVDVLLSSLVAALVSRRRPEELRLKVLAERRRWPDGLLHLPHQSGPFVDLTDTRGVCEALDEVHAELLLRMSLSQEERRDRPELVLVVGELAGLEVDPTVLDTLMLSGPEHGVRVLATTTSVSELPKRLLPYFDGRLVLRVESEDDSVELLGSDQASQLAGGADMLLRLGGRATVRLRAHKIEPEQLAQIGRLLRSTYGSADGCPTARAAIEEGDGACEDYTEPTITPHAAQPQDTATGLVLRGSRELSEDRRRQRARGPVRSTPSAPGAISDTVELDACTAENVDAPASTDGLGRAAITMHLLGRTSVMSRGRAISHEGRVNGVNSALHKEWELLHYVACHGPEGVSVSKVATAVWPRTDEETALRRLRPTASRLGSLLRAQVEGLECPVLRIERGMCRLDTEQIHCDTHRFLALSRTSGRGRQAALEEALPLYHGDLLVDASWSWVREPALTESVSLQEQYQDKFFELAEELVELYLAQGRTRDAIPVLKRMLDLFPPREEVFLKLIECRRRTGQRRELEQDGRDLLQKIKHLEDDPDEDQLDLEDVDLAPHVREAWERVLAEMSAP